MFDEDGWIVTNAHVVEGAATIKVHVPDRGNLSAQLLGVSPCDDLAVIEVPGSGFATAQFGDSNDLKLGENVMVMGYPLGQADLSVTRGIVSKLHVALDPLQDLVQTDASVNPGNSGGPLLNMRGEVIGIVAVKVQYDEAGNPIEGTAFAISSNLANERVPELTQGESRDWLGINTVPLQDLDPELEGLWIIGVSDNSPAQEAGLQPLDVLLTMAGLSMNSEADLCDVIRAHDTLSYEVLRDDYVVSGQIAMGRGSAAPSPTPTSPPVAEATTDVTRFTEVFQDDFSDPASGWDKRVTDLSEAGYEDGKYSILINDTDLLSWSNSGRSFNDFLLEVEATQVEGPDDNEYGVLVRYVDGDNFYHFVISGDGYYAVIKRQDGEWESLVTWTQSPHINRGQSTNHIAVVAEGSQFSLYVNEEHITDVTDDSFPGGDIGLMAGSFDEAGVLIHFDNVTVWAEEGPGPAVTPTTEFSPDFVDNFNSPASGWEIDDFDTGSVGYKDGAYFVISIGDGNTMWGKAGRSFDNLIIEVDATQVSAPVNNNNDYGVVCRAQGDGDGYYLLVSGDGQYAIFKAEDGSFEELVGWTESNVVQQGNATNRIHAMCDDDYLALVVNGELLGQVNDATFSRGDIALTATSYEDEPTEVHFDDLVVYTR
jgi:serine protease Do